MADVFNKLKKKIRILYKKYIKGYSDVEISLSEFRFPMVTQVWPTLVPSDSVEVLPWVQKYKNCEDRNDLYTNLDKLTEELK